MNVREALLVAERISRKGIKDWYRTHPRDRQAYLDSVFDIASLRGRIFFRAFDSLTNDQKWGAMAGALKTAIARFTPGDCHHVVYPEGLQAGPRRQLRIDLKNRGCERVSVDACRFETEPEIRLADALAGYVRAELYRGDGQRSVLTNLPDWLLDLDG